MDGATVGFALTRFEAVAGARLEVEGTWSGVRGVRFVRPALVVHDGATGGERTLLADLEHKPWPATEGEPWVAAFPWPDGDEGAAPPDVARTELAVAPSIVVPLAGGRGDRAPAAPPTSTPASTSTPPPAAPRRPQRRRRPDAAEVDALRAERDALRADLDATRRERDALRRQLDERDARDAGAARRREQALEERDAARRAAQQAARTVRREVEDAAERAAAQERERAEERLSRLREQLDVVEEERDRALAEPAGVVAPPVRIERPHEAQSTRADWAARTAAIVAVLVLLVLAITFLRAIA